MVSRAFAPHPCSCERLCLARARTKRPCVYRSRLAGVSTGTLRSGARFLHEYIHMCSLSASTHCLVSLSPSLRYRSLRLSRFHSSLPSSNPSPSPPPSPLHVCNENAHPCRAEASAQMRACTIAERVCVEGRRSPTCARAHRQGTCYPFTLEPNSMVSLEYAARFTADSDPEFVFCAVHPRPLSAPPRPALCARAGP